jgi:RNA polymerase sigma factor (sigma-70 family)
MTDETDDALLYYMAQKDSEPALAREAWGVFFERHREFVFEAFRRMSRSHPVFRFDDIEEATIDVFRKVYSHGAATFQMGDCPKDRQQNLVKAWLAQIATNTFHDVERTTFTGDVSVKNISDESWSAVARSRFDNDHPNQQREDSKDHERSSCDPDVQLIGRLLEGLPQFDRDALLLWAEKYNISTRKKEKLTSAELQASCEKLGTTPERLRQRQHRALKQIKEQVNEATAGKKRAG